MCKVRIVNSSNNYTPMNSTSIETDIPTEMVPIIQQIFNELNAKRKTAVYPSISIKKI